jgi:hypothetical protein
MQHKARLIAFLIRLAKAEKDGVRDVIAEKAVAFIISR